MLIYYELTGWRSIASYTVSGDRVYIFNDPYCPQEAGEYNWELEDGKLKLNVIEDPCSIRLRGQNLSKQAWSACPLPDGISGDAGQLPDGCEEDLTFLLTPTPLNLEVRVVVHGGDIRKFARPPDVYAYANSENNPPPEGILITNGGEGIPHPVTVALFGFSNEGSVKSGAP